ncbi:MAG TPA: polyprenyl synthetase family protein [Flavisolibacter sp.]|nr:polyprenyl synthetase family protein [Flavisolibacter sp.]
MHTFEELSKLFTEKFSVEHFPEHPRSLYEPNRYFLQLGGKRVRPVLCLMANELFDEINIDAWQVATAIELFHNFTLIHDDIMDNAPLRRNMQTVHEKFGNSTALLAGDVMLVAAYEYLNKISPKYKTSIIRLFNTTAREVCEGQQMDMDFEKQNAVGFDAYLNMISLKTSVLLAASLKMGAVLGGALERNQNLIYEFGRKLGLAFQVQDDYLDAFGDPKKVGKQVGGDILANKKTFLLIHALETAPAAKKEELQALFDSTSEQKVEKVLAIFKECKVGEWAHELKEKYMQEAFQHLEDIAVLSKRKEPLKQLALYLTQRQY